MELLICFIGFVFMVYGFIKIVSCFSVNGHIFDICFAYAMIIFVLGILLVSITFPYYIFYGA
jgi:hypothetical protein